MLRLLIVMMGLLMAAAGRAEDGAGQRRVATLLYARAVHEAELDHHDAVYDLLHHVLRLQPNHSAAMFRLATYEMFMRHDSLAWDLLTRSVALDPDNADYLETMTTYAERRDSIDIAIETCEHLARLQPGRSEVAAQLYRLYMKDGRSEDAINALTRIETIDGNSRAIALSKYKIYIEQLCDTDAANATLQNLAKEFPDDMQAQLILAERTDTARYRHLRDSLLYAPGTDDELRQELIVGQMRRGLADSTGRAEVERMFGRLTASRPDDISVWGAQLVFRQVLHQDIDSLITTLGQMRRIEPDNRTALVTLMQCHAEKEDYDALAALCDEAVTFYPDTYDFYYWSGMAHYQRDDRATALLRFTQAVRQIDEDTDPKAAARLYATQGDLLHDAGRLAEAFAAYDSCLVRDPDNISCLNNYAYYLSLLGRDLSRAEEMSYRTLRLEPDNRTYIDTYAWILFMQRKYGEAREQIDKVMRGVSTPAHMDSLSLSADVAAHAGDIYACQGDITQAVAYWQLALDMKPDGDGAALLRRKIKKKKYLKK